MIRISNGPLHHFFGYYGICPWDSTNRYHLALETDFHDRKVRSDDEAAIGLIDVHNGNFDRFGVTRAFNLQQGAMMHWIDAGFGEEFTYNDWEGDRLVTRAIHPVSRATRTVEGAIAAVSPCRTRAIGLNYARIYTQISYYGYANTQYSRETLTPIPDDDGLFMMDLQTGTCELMLAMPEVRAALPYPGLEREPHYLFHVVFSPDGRRMVFICRPCRPGGGAVHSLWIVNTDGTGLRCLIDYRHVVSHFDWIDDERLMISCNVLGTDQFVSLHVDTGQATPMPIEGFPADGHNAFSPDGGWLVCDTYPEGPGRACRLLLYDVEQKQTHHLGSFAHPATIKGGWRCDLHPRWSLDSKIISFDSVHEGTRQIYMATLSA